MECVALRLARQGETLLRVFPLILKNSGILVCARPSSTTGTQAALGSTTVLAAVESLRTASLKAD
jgi:hypothetical protein